HGVEDPETDCRDRRSGPWIERREVEASRTRAEDSPPSKRDQDDEFGTAQDYEHARRYLDSKPRRDSCEERPYDHEDPPRNIKAIRRLQYLLREGAHEREGDGG